MAYHRKGGKSAKRRSMKSKKGGSFGSLISQLSTPAVLFAANHVYGKNPDVTVRKKLVVANTTKRVPRRAKNALKSILVSK